MGSTPKAAAGAEVAWRQFGKRSSTEQVPQAMLDAMIHDFKTAPCEVAHLHGSSHDHRCCPHYHSERDRRRPVVPPEGGELRYRAEFCNEQFDSQRVCSRGDACDSCHNTAELLYHPDVFRKRLCYQANRCPRGSFCAFAHSRCELLVPHFGEAEESRPSEDFIAYKFKTQWCPIGGPHDWENCVYAHTYRDWRRTPLIGYSSRPCSQWARSTTNGSPELSYEDRCSRGFACHLAHGSKEQLYHPQFYKTSLCSEGYCKRGPLCAFFHGPRDTRRPGQGEADLAAARDPNERIEDILERHQPKYYNPPKYHTLEDPPYGANGSSKGQSKGRSKNRQAGAPLARAGRQPGRPAAPAPRQELLPAASAAPAGGQWGHPEPMVNEYPVFPVMVTNGGDFQGGMYAQGYGADLYQWMPCVEQASQHSTLIGYADGMDPWAVQMGYAPMAWTDASSSTGTPVGGALLDDGSGMRPQPFPGLDALPALPAPVPEELRHDSRQMPPPPPQRKSRSNKYYHLQDGMRTPSSFNGTPPISATPTEAPSPRPVEAAASSLDGSEVTSDRLSDETAREVAPGH